MSIQVSLPQFGDKYEGEKLRRLAQEVERLANLASTGGSSSSGGGGSSDTFEGLSDTLFAGLAEEDLAFYDIDDGLWKNRPLGLSDITEGMVTQHQAALSISASQVSGLGGPYAALSHTHTESDITDLQAYLLATSSPTITGAWSWQADVVLENNYRLRGEDTGGSPYNLIGVTAGDSVALGSSSLPMSIAATAVTIGADTNVTGTLSEGGVLVVLENRSVSTDDGLEGGGDLSADRTIGLAFDTLPLDTPLAADEFAFYDAVDGVHKAIAWSDLQAQIDHGALSGLADDDHTQYSLVDGTRAYTGIQTFVAADTGQASINLPHGTAPTTPDDGDVWTTTAGMYVRINGSTVGPLGTGGGGVSAFDDLSDVDLTGAANNDLLFRSGGNWVDTAGKLTWNGSVLAANTEANSSTALHIGETTTLRGDSQDSYMRLYGEQTGAIAYGAIAFNGANFSVSSNTTSAMQFSDVDVDLISGAILRIRDSANTDIADFSHDGTDFNLDFTNTTAFNINDIGLTVTNGYYYSSIGEMIRGADTWLRLNSAGDFTSGIYCGTGIFRTDGTFQVGSGGANVVMGTTGEFTFKPAGSYANFYTAAGTAGGLTIRDGDTSTIGLYVYTDATAANGGLLSGSGSWSVKIPFAGGQVFLAGDSVGHFETVTGSYGSVQVDGVEGSSGTYRGYSIGGRHVLMDDGGTTVGLYNDTDNEWHCLAVNNSYFRIYHNGISAFQTQTYNGTGVTSSAYVYDHGNTARDIGFNILPAFNSNTSDTLEARHCGAANYKNNTTAYTLTLASSSDLDFPPGGITTIVNGGSSGNYTINEGTSTTLYYLEPGVGLTDTAGGCTVGPGGVATIWRVSSTVYYIWGSEITP